jgi:hypothetical protein
MTLDRTLTILGWLVLFSPHITCVVLWIAYLISGAWP